MNSCVKIIFVAVIFVSCQNLCVSASGEGAATQLVHTNSGDVHGEVLHTLRHKIPFYSFKGIPYAKAPTGNLRFKAPEKVDDWSPHVHDASEYGNSCFQSSVFVTIIGPQNEDCLFLNIFTPNLKPDENLPVIFYIHGGGFIEGSGNEYAPDFLIEKDVILVTINYRVSIFGFLSLGLPEYSGNMGLKDQQLALEWVHQNIHHFGGDNKRITIAGHSAGGASAHFHTLSEKSRKYFANALVMSGVALNRWALSEKDDDEDMFNMFAIAHDIGRTATNNEELLEFLQQIPADELMKHTSHSKFVPSLGEPKTTYIEWNPRVESEHAHKPFLTAEPEDIMKHSVINVTTLFGITSEEWLCFGSAEMRVPEILKDFNENFQVELPFRGCKLDYNSEEYRKLAAEVRKQYFGTDVINNAKISEYIDLLSDVFFSYHLDKAAKLQANAGKSFYFRFSVDSDFNLFKALRNVDLPGSGHEDDRCYVHRCRLLDEKYQEMFKNPNSVNKVAYKTMDRMTKLWSNFAKFGVPSVENELEDVKPITGNDVNFIDIRNEGIVTGHNPNQKHVAFWNQLHEKYQKIVNETLKSERDEL